MKTNSSNSEHNSRSRNNGHSKNNSGAFYRGMWRLHFYAGVFCLPFVILLAISGTIYLFKPQIDRWVDQPFGNLEVLSSRATPDQHIASALASVPDSSFIHYQLPQSEREAVRVSVNAQGRHLLVYINPYTLDVLKTIGYEEQFIRQVRSFHGELMAGNIGSVLVELAGSWAIVLLVTGLFLWWPRKLRGLGGILYPRLSRRGRLWWREIHAVAGFWIAFFALFLLITGLPWALVWGTAFKEVRQLHAGANDHQHEIMWSISRAEEHAQRVQKMRTHLPQLSEALVASAQAQHVAPPAFLAPDQSDARLWRLTSDHQNRTVRSTVWLDGEGQVVRTQTFADQPLLDKAVAIGVSAHEGQLFGWFNQLLGLITTSGLVLMSVSGFLMWRKRKPHNALGAPEAQPDSRAARIAVAVLLLLALLLPLLAASLLVLVALEKLIMPHIPALQQWLGLRTQN